jgi:pimeloyl-ACP methyl ester carboxylesterase
MPGYGHAGTPKDFSYTADGYAAHLAALLDQPGIARADIVTHDFGAPWALAWAARHPDALASATLINTGVLIGYRWHRYARIWRTPGLGEVFQATTSRPAFRLLLGRENPRRTRDQIDRIYDASRSRATERAVLKLYRATPAAKLAGPAAALRPLDRPALVLWGTKDAYLPPRTGRAPAPGLSAGPRRTPQRPRPLGDARRPRTTRLPGYPLPHPAAARPRDHDRNTRQPAADFVILWPPPRQ